MHLDARSFRDLPSARCRRRQRMANATIAYSIYVPVRVKCSLRPIRETIKIESNNILSYAGFCRRVCVCPLRRRGHPIRCAGSNNVSLDFQFENRLIIIHFLVFFPVFGGENTVACRSAFKLRKKRSSAKRSRCKRDERTVHHHISYGVACEHPAQPKIDKSSFSFRNRASRRRLAGHRGECYA